MRKQLRPRQVQALNELRASLGSGKKRVILKAPTGFGKTVLAAEIIHRALERGKKVLFVVDAISLVDQTARSFYEQGITDIGVIQADHEMTKPDAAVQVCSQATLARRRHMPDADLVLIDECFPAGTLISTPRGSIPIELVSPGDLVHNASGIGRVFAKSTKTTASLIMVNTTNGKKITCTDNHPFFTRRGWVAAAKLESGDVIFCRENVSSMQSDISPKETMGRQIQQGRSRGGEIIYNADDLLQLLRQEIEKPNAQSVYEICSKQDTNTDGTPANSKRRKWEGNDDSAVFSADSFGAWLAGRTNNSDQDKIAGLSISLQGRSSKQGVDDCNRSGRAKPPLTFTKSSGQEERFIFSECRVDNISSIESGCPQVVYNLSVSGHPSYFAEGVLVHNCHVFYKFYQKWMEKWDAIPFIGLSATPYTTGLGKHFQQLICTATTQELIDEGDLCDFRVFAPAQPDLSKVKVIAGDYNEAELALVMNNADLVAGIVETWKAKAEGLPTLVYAVDRAHARAIQAEFDKACIKFEYIDAFTEREDREVIKKQFHNGEVAGVVSVGCLTKGIDWDVRCIVLARPTKSDMLYQQIIGRGLRNAPGKEYVLILDHSSTTLRLGFVTEVDERHGALSMGKKGQSVREVKEPQSKECSQCHFVKPPKTWECPNCGHKPERQPDVVHIAGQLEELTKTQKRNNKSSTAVDKAFFLGECLTYAHERGRAEGWAKHLYRAKYGVWPNKITPFMRAPTRGTLMYIKAQAISYAKGKANARV